MMVTRRHLAAALVALGFGLAGPVTGQDAPTAEQPDTILVLDASGSMWGQIDGVTKIEIARDVVSRILSDFPADRNLGLIAYGHRQRGRCDDIERLVEPAPGSAGRIVEIVNGLNPRGMTPMTDSVIAAAEALRSTERAATVILVSDGIETCHPDPCAAARALAEAGIDFTTHVIGFDVKGEAEALVQMRCLAEETGGSFLTADNAEELAEALAQVVVAAPVEVPLTLWARRGAPDLAAPRWHEDAAADLAPVEGPVVWRVTDADLNPVIDEAEGNPLSLALPAGDYIVTSSAVVLELAGQHALTLEPGGGITVTAEFPGPKPEPEPAVSISAPGRAVVGSAFTVEWQAEGLHPRDYVTIVPAGAADGDYGDYTRIEAESAGTLRAPAEPGLYEVRLQLEQSGRVLARAPIEIVDTAASISAPGRAVVGSAFTVEWQAEGLHPRDYVTIVPAGAADGDYGDYTRIEAESSGTLRAPAEPGLYEVRLQLEQSGRVLARAPIEIVDTAVSISAPGRAVVGSAFTVEWQAEGLHPRDYVTIVPAGAADGDYGAYTRIEAESAGTLRAPAEPGLYEVRLQLEQSGRVLARAPIEIVDTAASISAPGRAVVGSAFTVEWQAEGLHPRDYVTIVPAGAADGDYGDYTRIEAESAGTLRAPAEPGLYEVRLQLEQSGRVLARAPIEIVDTAASISAPGRAVVGSAFTVEWQAEGLHPRDYVTIVPAGAADGDYGAYTRIEAESAGTLRAPAEPGLYEVRLQLEQSGRVLARAPIEIVEGEVAVTGPERLRAGDTMALGWTGAIHPRDYVTIVPAGAADGDYGDYIRVGEANVGELRAPDMPGAYEIRYMLDAGGRVMARQAVEVVAADAPLDAGAGLIVPETATPGAVVTVEWTHEGDGDLRIALARADQPDFTWIGTESAVGRKSVELVLPDSAGRYEVRFLDLDAMIVLGRAIIVVGP